MGPPVLPEVDVMPLDVIPLLLMLSLVEPPPDDVITKEPELDVVLDGSPPELDVVMSPLDDDAFWSVDEPGN
jgi:hypothetical protein